MAKPEPLQPILDDDEVRQLANECGMPGKGEYWTWTEARYFAWVVEQAVLRKIQPIKYCNPPRANARGFTLPLQPPIEVASIEEASIRAGLQKRPRLWQCSPRH